MIHRTRCEPAISSRNRSSSVAFRLPFRPVRVYKSSFECWKMWYGSSRRTASSASTKGVSVSGCRAIVWSTAILSAILHFKKEKGA